MPRGRKPRLSTETLAAIAALTAQDWATMEALADLGMIPSTLLDTHIYGSRHVRKRRFRHARRAGLVELFRLPAGRRGQVSFTRLGPAGKRALAARGRSLGAAHERLETCCAVAPEAARLIAEGYFMARRQTADGGGRFSWVALPQAPAGAWAVARLEAPEGGAAEIVLVADGLPWSPREVATWLRDSKRRAGVLATTDPDRGAERARLADPEGRRFVAKPPAEALARVWARLVESRQPADRP